MSTNDFQLNEQSHEETHMELRAEGLVKRYGKRTVVNDVSINVRQGEMGCSDLMVLVKLPRSI